MNKLPVIFDTDLGGDCDDVLALCLLIAAQRKDVCNLLGVTSSVSDIPCAKCIASILDGAGLCGVPVFSMRENAPYPVKGCDYYASKTLASFPVSDDRLDALSAVKGLRKLLAASDGGVVIAATGSLANLAALLDSEGDEFSPLCGIDLVKEKVARFDVMAGGFFMPEGKPHREYNIRLNLDASRRFADACPVPIVWLPFETGLGMISGKAMVDKWGESRPWSLAYIRHGSVNGRDSWDPATLLYTLYGCGDVLEISAPGNVTVDETGVTRFVYDDHGLSRVLTAPDKAACAAEIDRLAEL